MPRLTTAVAVVSVIVSVAACDAGGSGPGPSGPLPVSGPPAVRAADGTPIPPGCTAAAYPAGGVQGCAGGGGGRFVACPTSGPDVVEVAPGDDIGRLVTDHPAGSTFHLTAGTYRGFSVVPKSGDRFCGDGIGATVLDGGGACVSAISSHFDASIDDVTIKDLTARDYCTAGSTDHQQVTFDSDSLGDIDQRADGWRIVSTEVRDSNIGIAVGNHSYVAGNLLVHNYRSGLSGGGIGSTFEYNTLIDNDPFGRAKSIDGDSQGSKSAITDGVTYRYNYVTGTSGPGLWADYLNSDCLFDHNYVQHLGDSGIFVEASYDCAVRDNVIANVGLQDNTADHIGDGIEVSTSGPVDVSGNWVIDSHQGIVIHQENRGSDRTLGNYHGPFCGNGSSVHDNHVLERPFRDDITRQTFTPSSGWIDLSLGPTCRSAADNTWTGNHYYLDDAARAAWLINGQPADWTQWQADGRDTAGTVEAVSAFPGPPVFRTGRGAYDPR